MPSESASALTAGLTPQVPINDKKFFPLYAKCIELDIPDLDIPELDIPELDIPELDIPMCDVGLIDEVGWFFPDLTFVTRHGCEPWDDLAMRVFER